MKNVMLLDKEKAELERLHRESPVHRQRQRAQALILSSRGYSIDALAEIFEIDRDTISAWLKRWRNRQDNNPVARALSDAPKSGRPSKLTKADRDEVLAMAAEGRPNLKAEALERFKKKRFRCVGTP